MLAVLIPSLPLLAAVIIGGGQMFGGLSGIAGERMTASVAVTAVTVSSLSALILFGAAWSGHTTGSYRMGLWLGSAGLEIPVNFIGSGFNISLAALFSLILMLITRFSVNYLHNEPGFHRFFFVLCLFASAMMLLVLSGNAVGTFFGWEIAGLCSYLLIAFAYDRPIAATNATRVFVTNRVGDAGFVLGISLSYLWIDSVNWSDIAVAAGRLSQGDATAIALCFAVAAFAKSAQLPFSPWLARAMEGPTPSSAVFYGAVMVHAGVFLTIQLQPLFERAPVAMAVVASVGSLTAVYGFIVGLTQTDIKSSLVFATIGQLGLMFLECGLGFWSLAGWHLCAHAVVRTYLVLTAPSILHNTHGNPIRPLTPAAANVRWLFIASLQRFWLDSITDWVLVKPLRRLARDLSYFDDHFVDPVLGMPAPAINAISSLAQLKERQIGAKLDNDADSFARGSGLAGKLAQWSAAVVDWFEYRFVLRGIGKGTIKYGRRLGHFANKVELLLLRPRYLALFVMITLLAAF
ncbi:MAG: NADH-quinone oxidoreductase subunit 5 family protein [Gammaproteobacteria bacterium]